MTASALKSALAYSGDGEVRTLSELIGVDQRLIRRARSGKDINAAAHLRLCAGLGIDPVTGAQGKATTIGDLHWTSLGSAARMARIQSKRNIRAEAKAAKVSTAALHRIERGEPVSIDNVLAVCRHLKRHPFDFVSPPVSRETRSAA